MKSRVLLFAILFISFCSLYAQSPEGFNYQAVIRNNAGEVLSNQSVGVRMSIIQGTANGTAVYRETFARTTNSFGLIDLVVGQGSATTGPFSTIDWSAGPYFMETAVDQNGGSNYTVLGTSQLMSVPFAMYAASSANDGADGQDGATGKSAYDIWLEAGNTGSEVDFLASLAGETGPAGADGEDGSGLTPSIQSEIDANTAKVGITPEQAGAILTNSADPDVDETNEIQTLSISDDQLSLSNGGGSVTIPTSLDNSVTNEIQTLSISDDQVSLSNGGGSVTIPTSADNSTSNELQTISRADEFVVLSNSGGMASVEDDDADPANEIQTLSISDDQLSLSNGGGSVTIPTSADNSTTNELNTSVVLNGTTLETTDAGGTRETDLSPLVDDADADPANEMNASVVLSGTDLETTDGGGTITTDLSSLVNDADADATNELISSVVLNGTTLETTDAGGTISTDLSSLVDDDDADAENEIQDLEIVGTTLRITGNASATEIQLQSQQAFGDIKHSFKTGDHDGWYLLNGRPLSALDDFARNNAEEFFSGNLPDARNRFLKGNSGSETNGMPGGSEFIAQANIPDYTINGTANADGVHSHSGTTSSNGSHNHTFANYNNTQTVNYNVAAAATQNAADNSFNSGNTGTNGNHNHTLNIEDSQAHTHSVTAQSGGSGTAYYQPHVITNIFVYLGGTSLEDLQALGKDTQEILDAGISPLTLFEDNSDILSEILPDPANPTFTYSKDGVEVTLTLQDLVDEEISLTDLHAFYGNDVVDVGGFTDVTALDMYDENPDLLLAMKADPDPVVDAKVLYDDGLAVSNLYNPGVLYDLSELYDNGNAYNSSELTSIVGVSTVDLFPAVMNVQDIFDGGVSPLTVYTDHSDKDAILLEMLADPYNPTFTFMSNTIDLPELVNQGIDQVQLYNTYQSELIALTTLNTMDLTNASNNMTLSEIASIWDFGGITALEQFVIDGFNIATLHGSSLFSIQELKDEFSASDLLTVSNIQELLDDTDINIQELRSGGAPAEDFHGVAYGGGLIFYTTPGGDAYIASLSDQSTGVRWADNGTASSAGGSIGDGVTNTTNMLAFDDGTTNGPNAATVCTGDINGFSDWFLPSRNELREVYDNLFDKPAFVYDNTAIYWSSTATSTTQCRAIDFSDGSTIDNQVRTLTHKVRAIRFIPGD